MGEKKAWQRPTLPLSSSSTIGAAGLNFRVRDGNGWNPCAIVTRQNMPLGISATAVSPTSQLPHLVADYRDGKERGERYWRISAPRSPFGSAAALILLHFRFAQVQGKIWSSLTVN